MSRIFLIQPTVLHLIEDVAFRLVSDCTFYLDGLFLLGDIQQTGPAAGLEVALVLFIKLSATTIWSSAIFWTQVT